MSYINKTNGRQIRTHIDKDAILLAICIYRELLLGIRERSENCRVVTAVSWSDIFELFPLYFLENRRHQFISGPFSFPTLSCHRTFRFWFLSQGPFGFFSEWVKSPSRVQLFAALWAVACQLLHPWGFPGKSTWVGCHFLLQRIFQTPRKNSGVPHFGQTLYCLSHQGIFFRLRQNFVFHFFNFIRLSENVQSYFRDFLT